MEFLKKVPFGVQDPSKCMKKHWSYKHPRLPAARVRKCANHRKHQKVVRNFLQEIVKTHENHQSFIKIMILSMSKHHVFLMKYLSFLRYPTNFWGILTVWAEWNNPNFCVFGAQKPSFGAKRGLWRPRRKTPYKRNVLEAFLEAREGKNSFWAPETKIKQNFLEIHRKMNF